jgi:hypothetical protein
MLRSIKNVFQTMRCTMRGSSFQVSVNYLFFFTLGSYFLYTDLFFFTLQSYFLYTDFEPGASQTEFRAQTRTLKDTPKNRDKNASSFINDYLSTARVAQH